MDVTFHITPNTARWITAKSFAEIHGLTCQTLANWRCLDRKAGMEPRPGYPTYRRFGKAVRYLYEPDARVVSGGNGALKVQGTA